MAEKIIYDTIIIGTGPAGLTASIYAGRYFLKHLVIGQVLGGTMSKAHKIENYPGIKSISGLKLAKKMEEQAKEYGADIRFEEVKSIKKGKNKMFEITTDMNSEPYRTHSVILASGMEHKNLNIPGEKEFIGKGVSYCATCDAGFFKNKTVVVIGGANAATMSSILLSKYAKHVYLIYRGDNLKGEPAWNQKVIDDSKTEIIYNTNITSINGDKFVENVTLDNAYKGEIILEAQGVFIEIGHVPTIVLAKKLGVEFTKENYVKVDSQGETNIEYFLAAGDITKASGNFKQIVTAVSEGAIAAKTAFDFKVSRENISKEIDYN